MFSIMLLLLLLLLLLLYLVMVVAVVVEVGIRLDQLTLVIAKVFLLSDRRNDFTAVV